QNPGKAPWLGSRYAPITVADGDDRAVRSQDRVGAPEPARLARGAGVGFRKARPRLLVEEHELTAFAVQMASAAEVEQGRDGFRADAALLHAGTGVMGKGLHAMRPLLR